MGIAQGYSKAIRQQLSQYAAWFPVVNVYKIGDYGIFKDGIFQSMGNLKDKYPGIELKEADSPSMEIDFLSSGTKTTKLDASGNPIGTFAGLGSATASLKIVFSQDDSNMIKAKLTVKQLQNIDQVASFLADQDDWRNKFSVVSKVYKGENCVIICSSKAGTEIELTADADILKQVEAGKVHGAIEFKSNSDSTFKAIGESGVLALGLFKLNIFNRVAVLAADSSKNFEVEELKGEMEDDY